MNHDLRSWATPWLRVEGAAVLALSAVLYSRGELGWIAFFILLFVPDVSMLGYLAGARAGAVAYNAAHTYTVPALLGGFAYYGQRADLLSVALIWAAHIGLDRLLGYGLKLPTGFRHTHLGLIGRGKS